jgi:hypothetical protein
VVVVAGIFGVLGMIGREDVDDPDLAIDDEPSQEESGDEADDDAEGPDPAEDPDPADDGAADEPDTEDPDVDAAPDADEPDEPDEPDESLAEEEPEPAPDPPAAIDPAEVSVQVLDGYRQDGGAAATAVFEQLQDAGYNIIARNPAIAYDVTTVLWTAGHEEEGRQVAQAIGAAEVREQPGNLSTQVNVHVVVGADRG